jgi:hypothetical protein
MQAKAIESTLRSQFNTLQTRGEYDAAAGVYLAAKSLYITDSRWHTALATSRAVYRLTHPTTQEGPTP